MTESFAHLFCKEKEKIGSLCVVIHKPNGLTLKSNTSEKVVLSLSLFLLCIFLFFSKHPINAISTRSRIGIREIDETQTVFATGEY